jgi:hypothetical protein
MANAPYASSIRLISTAGSGKSVFRLQRLFSAPERSKNYGPPPRGSLADVWSSVHAFARAREKGGRRGHAIPQIAKDR